VPHSEISSTPLQAFAEATSSVAFCWNCDSRRIVRPHWAVSSSKPETISAVSVGFVSSIAARKSSVRARWGEPRGE